MNLVIPECAEVKYAKERLLIFKEFFRKKHAFWKCVERMSYE